MVASCANLTPFSHLGDLLARKMRRLYFFSNRSCCWWLRSLKFGGQTFLAGYGLLAAASGARFVMGSFADWASRLMSVGNIATSSRDSGGPMQEMSEYCLRLSRAHEARSARLHRAGSQHRHTGPGSVSATVRIAPWDLCPAIDFHPSSFDLVRL